MHLILLTQLHILVSMKRLTVNLPDDIHRRLKVACAERDIDMSEVIRALVEGYLKGLGDDVVVNAPGN